MDIDMLLAKVDPETLIIIYWIFVPAFCAFLLLCVLTKSDRALRKKANRRLKLLRETGTPLSQVTRYEDIPRLEANQRNQLYLPLLRGGGNWNLGPFGESEVIRGNPSQFEKQFVEEFLRLMTEFGYEETHVFRSMARRELEDKNKPQNKNLVLGNEVPAVTFYYGFPNNTSVFYTFAFKRSGKNIVIRTARGSVWPEIELPGYIGTFFEGGRYLVLLFIPFLNVLFLILTLFASVKLFLGEYPESFRLVAGDLSGITQEYFGASSFEDHEDYHNALAASRDKLINEWSVELMD